MILNPGCGFGIVVSIGYSYQTGTYWWILMLCAAPFVVWSTMTFNEYAYREENAKRKSEYLKWRAEFSKTHDFIRDGMDEDGDFIEVWRNRKTQKLVYR